MLAKVNSSAPLGIEAYSVDVEVDVSRGLPGMTIVGLPDSAVKESRDRVRAAIRNSKFKFPAKKITVNLAPANIKKEGAAFDLPIAVGILLATEQIKGCNFDDCILLGELSLNGNIRKVNGVLPITLSAKKHKFKRIIVPQANADEAAVVEDVEVYPVKSLIEVVALLTGKKYLYPHKVDLAGLFEKHLQYEVDFSDVKGQEHVKRAMEVAAAGGHNILLIGPPGTGKTMLAKRLSTIIPNMSLEEALETTKIHSITGLLSSKNSLVANRPFRNPHHTISDAGLIGGGTYPKPGEVSLAHNGVLFLDELPEFKRNVLEVLRQPLEDGKVTISRAAHSLTFPAKFMLVAAMNPCICGFFGDPHKNCNCTPMQIQRYISKISGPLLDRIDIHIEVGAVKYRELTGEASGESSAQIKERVQKSHEIQKERYLHKRIYYNAHMRSKDIKHFCQIDEKVKALLKMAIEELGISARAYDKILKVSRTIADLAGEENIKEEHVSEAIQYRSLDRQSWLG